MPVVEKDRDKLCFVTQWGCYRYKVATQGYLASGDGYCHRFSEITKGIENRRTIVDDTVIWGKDLEENFNEVCKLLDVCCKASLIFLPDKFQFGQDTVDFAGLEITDDGVRSGRSIPSSNKHNRSQIFLRDDQPGILCFCHVAHHGAFSTPSQTR